jgi:uncharacterized protein YecT (DUF1311 family)
LRQAKPAAAGASLHAGLRVQRREAVKIKMKLVILTFISMSFSSFTSLKGQSKSVELHPFIRWEIRQIERIDSIGAAFIKQGDQKILDQRDSIENWLEDSIGQIKVEHREDVLLKLDAWDTLVNSDLINIPLSGNRYSAVDDLLNSIYGLIQGQSNQQEKIALKKDERGWLKKRDAYFKKVDREEAHEERETEGGGRNEVAVIERNMACADFVSQRVRYLAKKIRS